MFKIVDNFTKRPKADLVILPCFQETKRAKPAVHLDDLEPLISPIIASGDFSGKEGESMLVHLTTLPKAKERRLLLLGIGKKNLCHLERLRRSYAAAMKRCRNKKWPQINVILPSLKELDVNEVTRAVSEGVGLTLYLFEEWKTIKKPYHIKQITFVGAKEIKIPQKTLNILSGVNLARDLVNRNALDITPQTLAAQAQKLTTHFSSVTTTTLNKKQIEKEKMGLFLAVSNGSHMDPVLITTQYKGNPKTSDLIMIVGKGVTFDTGGLNLKPTYSIEDMRTDMGGAAAALGIIQAAASMHLKHNIVAIIPATENAISSYSYKPGDTYRACQGNTVEIINTDAEGRLILADALTYGQKKFSPKYIIDIATLTGAIVVALGEERAGLFSNNDTLSKYAMQAGEETGERVWRMPIDPEYKPLLKSNFADIKNAATPKGQAGSITAALFLQEFIADDTPWMHLDIAGTSFIGTSKHYHSTQATGAGVRIVLRTIELCSHEL